MADNMQTQLVLAQNQHAFIQDATKGTVQVYSGPHASSLSPNDRPVVYDRVKDEFVNVSQEQAIRQNPLVPEGHYIVLENPAFDGETLIQPRQGINSPRDLKVGRKIVIPGPISFPLWPGQFAESLSGHHLRSNQYLIVRVYNADEANKNAPDYLKTKMKEGEGFEPFTPGALLIIKGTEASFFIPPTGFEVLKENNSYVREALTLERLEYCILLDEDGNKRYEIGPQVVFPEATERFLTKNSESTTRKLKAIELNDQMGLYAKVIAEKEAGIPVPADLKEGDEFTSEKHKAVCVVRGDKAYFKVGEELFITGKHQRIYYPCAELALIGYADPNKPGLTRERYYGITLSKGEGRYVLDKNAGEIRKVTGPQILLPDPRNEVIVRRVLDDRTVKLWYPNSKDALAFNQSLRSLVEGSTSYLADSVVLSAAADANRSMNRGTQYSKQLVGSFDGDNKLMRSGKFTPPPTITLSNKYDNVPSITIYTGYAVQVVDKSGNRRIEVGPKTILLEYDEFLEVLQLSTGKPKNTDALEPCVYLPVDNDFISDIIQVETKDLVYLNLKVSYNVNFLHEYQDKWFNIENYVKYLCDHMRSLLKKEVKKYNLFEVWSNTNTLVRKVVLNMTEDETSKRLFPENGMEVFDVVILERIAADPEIQMLLENGQHKTTEVSLALNSDEQNLVVLRRSTEIKNEIADLESGVVIHREEQKQKSFKAEAETAMVKLAAEVKELSARKKAEVEIQTQIDLVSSAIFNRRKVELDYEIGQEAERVGFFEKKLAAISPNLIQAFATLGETEFASKLTAAIAPLALHEQQGIGVTLERVFKGTPLEALLNNMQSHAASNRGVHK